MQIKDVFYDTNAEKLESPCTMVWKTDEDYKDQDAFMKYLYVANSAQ